MNKGKLKAAWMETPKFETTSNFKEFFLAHDALCNLESELVFSIFHRYTCKAGCKMCYVMDEWIEDNEFTQHYVPNAIPPHIEQRILEAFTYFEFVTTMDDLYHIKNTYPHLYEFYVRNSHLMSSTAMTDIAFIQQYDIIMQDMNFKTIYEISFSDKFLNLKAGKMVEDIIVKLDQMNQKSPIQKLKVILCDGKESDAERDPAVKRIVEWCNANSIFVDIYDDIRQGRNKRYDIGTADHQETNHLQSTTDSFIFQILCESTHMQYTSMFLTISQSIGKDSTPYYDVADELNIEHLISNMLTAKVALYREYVQRIQASCERIPGNRNRYSGYFEYVYTSVTVNKKFNFIPRILMRPFTKMYQMLASDGFVDTQYGLLKKNTDHTTIIPVLSVSDQPKLKLEHIPIVGAKHVK